MTGVNFTKTDEDYIWKIQISPTEYFTHIGYVYEDETGNFSTEIYPSIEMAKYYQLRYAETLK